MNAAAGLLGLIAGGLIESGLTWTGLAVAMVGVLVFHYQETITEHLERGPAVDVIEHREEGLPDREVHEFSVLHREYKQIQQEKRKEAERKAKNRGTGGNRSLNKQ